jgi:hypothetical protein
VIERSAEKAFRREPENYGRTGTHPGETPASGRINRIGAAAASARRPGSSVRGQVVHTGRLADARGPAGCSAELLQQNQPGLRG